MNNQQVYDLSFVDGQLHILRKPYKTWTEYNFKFVPSSRVS
jgi:hypothetical protein